MERICKKTEKGFRLSVQKRKPHLDFALKNFAAKAFLCGILLFCSCDAFSESGKDGLKISLPEGAFRGDFAAVNFECRLRDFEGIARILDENGKTLASAKAFSLKKGKRGGKKIAVLGISTWIPAGKYRIEAEISADGKAISSAQKDFFVREVEYFEETIFLDDANTAIKTDSSDERKAQIDRLNALLFSAREDAPRALSAFSPPVEPKTRRSAEFGDRRIYSYQKGGRSESPHFGIDYAVPTGTVVRSCAKGRVVLAENRISTGWSVCIEHFPGVYSLYYHLSKLECSVGQKVRAGKKIGLSGATGLATGPHLHWEIRVNGEAVSPDFFVERGLK